MAHIPRLSKFLSCNSPRICLARFSSPPAVAYTDSPKNTLDGHRLLRSAHEPSLIVYDAPSQPSENLTRRSARSPNSLTDYYNARRRLASHSPRQVRSSTSNSVISTGSSPLNSVPHPENVHARIFDSPSKPREYYIRPQPKRDLPELRSSLPLIAILGALGLSAWGAFVFYVTNMERLSSSVVRQLAFNLRSNELVKETLGVDVTLEGKWWLGGEPWINGAINLLQGNVDVSFRVKGSKGAGTVYFTSVREEKGQPFTILRSKIICDDGVVLHLRDA
ncbi:cytochrome oxidase complex assembly protein 1-domain-containing protein [Gautieria morchelliformis]|nr:cytochrome oxidase complex assembly protein 1-domain-containing protein [Gautieria morchelliformis]